MADELVRVTVGQKIYLCEEPEEGKGKTVLQNAACFDAEDWQDSIGEWITQANLGELETVRLDDSQGFTVRKLTVEQRRFLAQRQGDMKEIKRTILPTLENREFDKE